jgi:hypothetical protein
MAILWLLKGSERNCEKMDVCRFIFIFLCQILGQTLINLIRHLLLGTMRFHKYLAKVTTQTALLAL